MSNQKDQTSNKSNYATKSYINISGTAFKVNKKSFNNKHYEKETELNFDREAYDTRTVIKQKPPK